MLKQGKFLKSAAFALAFGLSGVLCGCGKDSPQPSEQSDLSSYIEQSCQFKLNDGDSDFPDHVSEAKIVKAYFDKPYALNWLQLIGHQSIRATLDDMNSLGVYVSKAPSKSSKSCKPFSLVQSMPSDVAEEWNRATKAVGEGQAGFVAGLYLPAKKAIVVREDANRWTLVHEFMHHNFKTHSPNSEADMEKYRSDLLVLPKRIGAILKDPSLKERERIKTVTPLFLRVVTAADYFLIEFPLEEVAIEATLQDKVDSGELTYVPSKAYANANWYISHSMETVRGFYSTLDDTYSSLRREAGRLGAWNEYDALGQYYETKSKRFEQIEEMITARNISLAAKTGSGSFAYLSEMDSTPVNGWAPCADAASGFDILDRVTNEFRDN